MEENIPPHHITLKVVRKISELIRRISPKKGKKEISLAKLSEKCQCSPEFLGYLRDGLRGPGVQLDYFLKIWQGLGHPPETLIADCNVDPLLAERIKRIQESDWKEFFDLVINVLGDAEYADPAELGEIKGDLKNLWRRIVKLKEQPLAAPGEKLSNSAGE